MRYLISLRTNGNASAELRRARADDRDWRSFHCEEESRDDVARGDARGERGWKAFAHAQRTNAGPVPATGPTSDWSAYHAHDPRADEVDSAMGRAKPGTAESPADNTRSEAIRRGGPALRELLRLGFAYVLRTGAAPLAWAEGYVTWLWKGKKDRLCWRSYRGIVLGSNMAKTFERVLLERLHLFVGRTRAISGWQAIGQSGVDTLSQVYYLHEAAQWRKARNRASYLLIADVAGALEPAHLAAAALGASAAQGHLRRAAPRPADALRHQPRPARPRRWPLHPRRRPRDGCRRRARALPPLVRLHGRRAPGGGPRVWARRLRGPPGHGSVVWRLHVHGRRIALAWDAQSQRCPNQAAKREFAIARKDCASEEWGHPLQNRTGWRHMSSLYLARSKFRLLPHKSLVQCA